MIIFAQQCQKLRKDCQHGAAYTED